MGTSLNAVPRLVLACHTARPGNEKHVQHHTTTHVRKVGKRQENGGEEEQAKGELKVVKAQLPEHNAEKQAHEHGLADARTEEPLVACKHPPLALQKVLEHEAVRLLRIVRARSVPVK